MDHDFVINKEKMLNLYRSDISEYIQLMHFIGKTDPWKISIVQVKDENFLKQKI